MNFIVCIAVFVSLLASAVFGQVNAVISARDFRVANEQRLLHQFIELLSIPNVASDTPNIIRNSEYLIDMMRKSGLNPRALTLNDRAVPPAVYGEWITPGAKQTIIFYAHYDGQPVDLKAWTVTPPFTPVIFDKPFEKGGRAVAMPNTGGRIDPEWRLYARSASDDKAGVFAILTALEALNAKGIKPTVNIKFLFEGEEEAGSPHIGEILAQ